MRYLVTPRFAPSKFVWLKSAPSRTAPNRLTPRSSTPGSCASSKIRVSQVRPDSPIGIRRRGPASLPRDPTEFSSRADAHAGVWRSVRLDILLVRCPQLRLPLRRGLTVMWLLLADVISNRALGLVRLLTHGAPLSPWSLCQYSRGARNLSSGSVTGQADLRSG
jgi:hypothetical protein